MYVYAYICMYTIIFELYFQGYTNVATGEEKANPPLCSTIFDSWGHCTLATDGLTDTGWASAGQGVGLWIQVDIPR